MNITQKNCSNDIFNVTFKKPDDTCWHTEAANISTPLTLTFKISANNPSIIKKITWDFGNGNQPKTFTNRNQNLKDHEIGCKYKKSHNSTITIQASVYTEDGMFTTSPINTTTLNNVIKEHYVIPEDFKNQILKYYKTNVFTNDVADSIYKIASRLAFAPNFINYCVDEETEALTKRGWLKYNEIKTSDMILSYDVETKRLVWSNIEEVYTNKYNGQMHHLTNQGIDALVSPGHRFVTKERGLAKVETLRAKEHLILMGLPVEDNHLPRYSNDFVELVGWAVTEGNYLSGKHTHSLQIFQKEGPKANLIRDCLNRLNIKYKEYRWSNPEIIGFRFNKDFANNIINDIAPQKVISMDFILSLTHEQRLLLIDTMIKGDGYIVERKERKSTFGYFQKNKKHIDTFIALCTLSGITTSTSFVINNTQFGVSEGYSVYFYNDPKHTCSVEHTDMYGGRTKPGGDNKIRNNKPTHDYNGMIWCPRTEYGTFVCRRGKYVYITGNSYREEMVGDAVVRMIEALTTHKFDLLKCGKGNAFSYFTKIAFHAFCNRIKKEKKMREALTGYQNEVHGNSSGENRPTQSHDMDGYDYENI